MDLSHRSAWVFDMDGTLTVPVHDFDAIRLELGLPAGRPILEELDRLPAAEAAPLHLRLEAIEEELARASRPAEGAVALVTGLVERGARVGILTRNTRANARLTLAAIGLAGAFDPADVLGRDEAPPKPDPGGVLDLLARWSAQPAQAVMVGDYRFDLEAGRAAGVATVHVAPDDAPGWAALTDLRTSSLASLLPASR